MTHTTAQLSSPDSSHTSTPTMAKTTGSRPDCLDFRHHLLEQCVRESLVNH